MSTTLDRSKNSLLENLGRLFLWMALTVSLFVIADFVGVRPRGVVFFPPLVPIIFAFSLFLFYGATAERARASRIGFWEVQLYGHEPRVRLVAFIGLIVSAICVGIIELMQYVTR